MKQTVKILFLSILVLNSFVLSAQVININLEPLPDVNYDHLSRIDTIVNNYIGKEYSNGVVTLVVKDNQLVYWKGYGFLDKDSSKPMPKDAIFRIMSQTKAITSVGIMILYEQGKIYLDEPIGNFIPEFKNQQVLDQFNEADSTYTTIPAKRNVTFRDLLTHSSGIDYAGIGSPIANAIYGKAKIPSGLGNFNASLLQKMKALGKLPLLFQPGEKFRYGLNTDLLGCLIEVISGKTLDEFFRQHIFNPLGMKDTYYNLPQSKASRLTTVYTEDSLQNIIKWRKGFNNIDPDYPLIPKSYFSGGAGLSSTAMDYAIFLQMLLNGGIYNDHRILSPRSVELMTNNQLEYSYNGVDNFGLGFALTSSISASKNARNKDSYSWGGYLGTTYWVDPKENLVCLIMTQHTPNSHWELFTKIENIIYSSIN
ncbi:serine hydrolase domain-containing protein [Aegicerativicinus sediminis]|uniref:serine hydrolase domain-containing protein n=1 Tax=Aegicerativicinus sediminis TaxID=2893202 RepID=UPI001E599333|nr:serine hydrolase domain-containing protein [Aegicerativicinus sediminis]